MMMQLLGHSNGIQNWGTKWVCLYGSITIGCPQKLSIFEKPEWYKHRRVKALSIKANKKCAEHTREKFQIEKNMKSFFTYDIINAKNTDLAL